MAKNTKKTTSVFKNSKLSINKFSLIGLTAFALVFGAAGAIIYHRSFAETICSQSTFRQGSTGHCVKDIQTLVNFGNYWNNTGNYIAVDGIYGPITKQAVVKYQTKLKAGYTDPWGTWHHVGQIINDGIVRPNSYLCDVGTSRYWPARIYDATTDYDCNVIVVE